MIQLDARVVALMILAGLVMLAAPLALGGGIIAAGVVAAFLAGRSVIRGEEADVTVAIVGGGLVALLALGRGHTAAFAVCAGVFVSAEIAALGRRLGMDHEAPAGPEAAIVATTVGLGLGAGAVVALVASVRASAPIANIALVVGIVLGLVMIAVNRLRT